MDTRAARERVAAASRRLAEAGLVLGTAGNVSAATDDELIAITPTGANLATLDAEQVTVVDRRGEPVEGELAPTSELALHLGVYERYGAGAVVHTHAPVATALACVIDELPLVHYGMLALGGSIRVAPYRTFGTPELATATLEALAGRTAALMSNHGAINFAADPETAVEQAFLLEWACEVYWRAAAIGAPRTLSERDQQAVIEQVVSRGYGATRSHAG
jgi:L-fuculose-phosphate aldolase